MYKEFVSELGTLWSMEVRYEENACNRWNCICQ